MGALGPDERGTDRGRDRDKGTRDSCLRGQVATPSSSRSRSNDGDDGWEDDEAGAIEEHFGQLWYLLSSSQPTASQGPRVLDGGERVRNLVWTQRDLWEKREFKIKDCYPATGKFKWCGSPMKLRFAEDVWGKGLGNPSPPS